MSFYHLKKKKKKSTSETRKLRIARETNEAFTATSTRARKSSHREKPFSRWFPVASNWRFEPKPAHTPILTPNGDMEPRDPK